jgi:hypothetical protein
MIAALRSKYNFVDEMSTTEIPLLMIALEIRTIFFQHQVDVVEIFVAFSFLLMIYRSFGRKDVTRQKGSWDGMAEPSGT